MFPHEPMDLGPVEWVGESCFRVLDTYFTVRYDDAEAGAYIEFVLGGFQVEPDINEQRNPPTPNFPPRYSICLDDRDPGDVRTCLYYGDTRMISTVTQDAALTHLFWNVNSEAVRQTGSYFLVHAGCVIAPTGPCVVLPAESGSGKTTLVAGLVRDGFRYLSDEAAVFDPVLRQVHPFPKALTLKPGSFPLFPELEHNARNGPQPKAWHVQPEQLGAGPTVTEPTVARLVIAPTYDADASGVELTPLSSGETALLLASSSLNLRRYGARALPLVADVARATTGYKMRFDDLAAGVAAVHELAATAAKEDAEREGA